jgi:hypothetical protein
MVPFVRSKQMRRGKWRRWVRGGWRDPEIKQGGERRTTRAGGARELPERAGGGRLLSLSMKKRKEKGDGRWAAEPVRGWMARAGPEGKERREGKVGRQRERGSRARWAARGEKGKRPGERGLELAG